MTTDKQEAAKVAVVTGGASGIGFAITQALLGDGYVVAVADIEDAAIDEALRVLDDKKAFGYRVDVSSAVAMEELAARISRELGPVDVLVNNAGVQAGGGVHEVAPETWSWVMNVNFGGVVNGCRAFLPAMRERNRGHVVNMSSVGAVAGGGPAGAPYIASKTAILTLTQSLAAELESSGLDVRATVVLAGTTDTNFGEAERNKPAGVPGSVDSELRARAVAATAARSANGLKPHEVAKVVMDALADGRFYALTHPELTVQLYRAVGDRIEAEATKN